MAPELDLEGTGPSSNGPSPPKLVKYRNMTGIYTPKSLVFSDPPRPAPNLGVYARVVKEEAKAGLQYTIMATIINVSYFGQIILAATLTALSASKTSTIAVTVLGALNTVIAGIQTYLKGQGLPNRLQQYKFSLRKLREHMEDRERDFSDENCALDVDEVVEDVHAMYLAVRQTAEDNIPDNYLPMGGAGKKLLPDSGQESNGDIDPRRKDASAGADDSAIIEALSTAEEAKAGSANGGAKPGTGAGANPNGGVGTENAPLLPKGRK